MSGKQAVALLTDQSKLREGFNRRGAWIELGSGEPDIRGNPTGRAIVIHR